MFNQPQLDRISTHNCSKAQKCYKIKILLIAPKRCSALQSDACCQTIIIQHDKLVSITSEIQKKNRQGVRHGNQERGHCQEEGKDGDGAERGDCGSQEERQDGDEAPAEAKKEENERMRLEGG